MIDPQRLALRVHRGLYCICRLGPGEPLPAWTAPAAFCSVTRTPEELSVVCDQDVVPAPIEADRGWRLLAGLTTTLANANVTVFALSTYDTDYLLVRDEALERAVAAFREAGYEVV